MQFIVGGFLLTHCEDFDNNMLPLKEAIERKGIQALGAKSLFWMGAVKLEAYPGAGSWTYRVGNQTNLATIVFYFTKTKTGHHKRTRMAPASALFPFICRGKGSSSFCMDRIRTQA